jgi:cyclophilin family peptidyl-prolyl cis-trans isomerase
MLIRVRPLVLFPLAAGALLLAAGAFAQDAPPLPDGLYAIFSTGMGKFTAKLYEKDAPISVANFVGLAQGTKAWLDPKTRTMVKRPLYDNIVFHRVLPDEMIQSGSATESGNHNCGIRIRDEFLPGLRFDRAGKLAVANSGGQDSGGCQFFITTGPMTTWDGKYAVFGLVVEGMDVVEAINHAPCRGEKPVNPVKLVSVTIERIGPEPPQKPQKIKKK